MRLAVFLLLLVVGCHYTDSHLAKLYEHPEAASKAIFYILRGIEGSLLFVVIASIVRSRFVLLVCLFGVFEESQTAICRAAKPIDTKPAVELFTGICGEPLYGIGLVAAGVIALAIEYELGRRRGKGRT